MKNCIKKCAEVEVWKCCFHGESIHTVVTDRDRSFKLSVAACCPQFSHVINEFIRVVVDSTMSSKRVNTGDQDKQRSGDCIFGRTFSALSPEACARVFANAMSGDNNAPEEIS
jgi:hypothetical protein